MKALVIIFLTAASDDMSSMFRGYEVGAVDYVFKPLNPEILRNKVAVFVAVASEGGRSPVEPAVMVTEPALRGVSRPWRFTSAT